jgi:hypothetical protein
LASPASQSTIEFIGEAMIASMAPDCDQQRIRHSALNDIHLRHLARIIHGGVDFLEVSGD